MIDWGCSVMAHSNCDLCCRNRPHTVYFIIKVHYTSDCVKTTTSYASGSFDVQPHLILSHFHLFTLNFRCKIQNISETYLHIYVFHPCALLHFMFIIPEYCLIVVDVQTLLMFTRVYSH